MTVNNKEVLTSDLELLMKKGKKIKLETTKCKKCKSDLDIRITTELDKKEEKKGKEPRVLMVYGVCDKCKIVYMMDIIPIEEIPKIKRIPQPLRRKDE